MRPSDRTVEQPLIPITAAKGCTLWLTPLEYCNGIARGKVLRRAEKMRTRRLKERNTRGDK